jgi:CheY-like chemotaxis protein
MLVEDELIIAADLKNRLEDMGCQVVAIVSSGHEAMEAASKHHPQMVFMDIRLKGQMNGIEAARLIQSKAPVRFVFMTAQTDNDTQTYIKNMPHSQIISKPIFDTDLVDVFSEENNSWV